MTTKPKAPATLAAAADPEILIEVRGRAGRWQYAVKDGTGSRAWGSWYASAAAAVEAALASEKREASQPSGKGKP